MKIVWHLRWIKAFFYCASCVISQIWKKFYTNPKRVFIIRKYIRATAKVWERVSRKFQGKFEVKLDPDKLKVKNQVVKIYQTFAMLPWHFGAFYMLCWRTSRTELIVLNLYIRSDIVCLHEINLTSNFTCNARLTRSSAAVV